jgi:hypothetical protein
MFLLLLRSLRQYRWFALLGGALLLSSVGNGLTYVIVFGKLLTLEAKPSALTLAYILALAPGIPGSMVAEKLMNKLPLIPLLAFGEILGLVGLIFPLCSLYNDSQILLLLSQAVAAFASGMMVPVLSQLLKNGLHAADLPAASGLETLIFAANVIFGIGIGTLLYGKLSALVLLALDALSFVLATGLLFAAYKSYRRVHQQDMGEKETEVALRWRTLSQRQRRGLLMLPALALVGAPAMALLPALATHFGGETVDTGLMLLLARSTGQLIGPLLLSENQLRRYTDKISFAIIFFALFIICYGLVSVTNRQWLAMMLIVLAHISTNIVYVLATLNIMRSFPASLTGKAMAKSWRLQLLITLILPLIAGFAADRYDPVWVLYFSAGSGFMTVVIGLLANRYLGRREDAELNLERNNP